MFAAESGQTHELGVVCGDCLQRIVVGRIDQFAEFLDILASQFATDQEKKGSVDK